MAHNAGKGSAQRPTEVPREQFESNWDRIFGKKDKQERGQLQSMVHVDESFYQEVENTNTPGPIIKPAA